MKPQRGRAGPRWRRRAEARPAEIIAAGLDSFAKRGFAATTLDEVARAAGVSKGTLYLYFPNKEELFKAVVRETLVPNLAAAEVALAGIDRPDAATLLAIVGRLMHGVALTKAGAIPRLVLAEAGNFPDLARFYAQEVVARGLRLLGGLIERGGRAGTMRGVDPVAATLVVMAPILILSLWKSTLEPHAPMAIDPARFFETYAAIMTHGLAAGRT